MSSPVPSLPPPAPLPGSAPALGLDAANVDAAGLQPADVERADVGPADVERAGATGPGEARRRFLGPRLELSVPWRWILGVGWSAVMGALGGIAQSAFLADTGPFWLGLKPLPFALPVLTLLALVGNWRRTITVSWLASVATAAVAMGDVVAGYRPVALTEGICAASAVALTLAAQLSRPGTGEAARALDAAAAQAAADAALAIDAAAAAATPWRAPGEPAS